MNALDVVVASDKDIENWLLYEDNSPGLDLEAVKLALRRPYIRKLLRACRWNFYTTNAKIVEQAASELGLVAVFDYVSDRTYKGKSIAVLADIREAA